MLNFKFELNLSMHLEKKCRKWTDGKLDGRRATTLEFDLQYIQFRTKSYAKSSSICIHELKEKSVENCKTAYFLYSKFKKRQTRRTCWDVLWYGAGIFGASVCLWVCQESLLTRYRLNCSSWDGQTCTHTTMTRGPTLLIFKVMGQRSRSHARHCC